MEFSDRKVSDYYYQSYVSLTNYEKKIIVEDAKEDVVASCKESLDKDISKHNNIVSFKDFNNSYQKLHSDDFYKENEEEITNYVYSNITSYIGEHMLQNGFAICSDIDISIIGNLFDDKSIVFATSFCVINSDYKLNIPHIYIPKYQLNNEDVGMILTEMLITKNEYEMIPSSVVTSFSDITIDFKKDDYEITDATMDVDRFCDLFLIDNKDVYGKGIGTYTLANKIDKPCTLTIKNIMEKKVHEIDDSLVEKIKTLNCKTVVEAIQKIKENYSFTFTINFGVSKVLDALLKINEFTFDKYVINHYLDTNYETDEKALRNLDEEDKDAITMKYITSIIFAQHLVDMDKYIEDMHIEYDLLCLTTGSDTIGSFDDFFETRSLMYALYDYCIEKKLIERSQPWKTKY